MKPLFNLKKTVESTTSVYCTDLQRLFYDFSTHRMGDTASQKNQKKIFANQHTRHSRYDSTAFFRFKKALLSLTLIGSLSVNAADYGTVSD